MNAIKGMATLYGAQGVGVNRCQKTNCSPQFRDPVQWKPLFAMQGMQDDRQLDQIRDPGPLTHSHDGYVNHDRSGVDGKQGIGDSKPQIVV
nr:MULTISPECIES: hypothetical protein [Kyrpidia]